VMLKAEIKDLPLTFGNFRDWLPRQLKTHRQHR